MSPVADSVSFDTDKIGPNIQLNQKKLVPDWSESVLWPDTDVWTRSLNWSWLSLNTSKNFDTNTVDYLMNKILYNHRIQWTIDEIQLSSDINNLHTLIKNKKNKYNNNNYARLPKIIKSSVFPQFPSLKNKLYFPHLVFHSEKSSTNRK